MSDKVEVMARGMCGEKWPQDAGRFRKRASKAEKALEAAGYAIVPVEPTEEMWGGLARSIAMWLSFHQPTPRKLLNHLELIGHKIPQWLLKEDEMKSLDHVVSKGTRCVIIYRAMIADSTNEK